MAVARTYGTLELRGAMWVMDRVEPHVCIRLKHLFPRIPKANAPPYTFPNDPNTAADLVWFLQRYPMAANDADIDHLHARRMLFERNMAEVDRIFAPDYMAPALAGLRDGQELRHYQQQLVEMLRLSPRLLCGDEVGLGKTYEAAGACLLPDALPAIVVCYPHLQEQWREKIEAFTTLKCEIVKTTRPRALRDSADVKIFRWTQLSGWADVWSTINPRTSIFDEVQELRTGVKRGYSSGSLRCTSAKRLAQVSHYTLGLTATPIYNWGIEMWHVLDALGIDVLGDYGDFDREWCGGAGHITDPKALGTFLREQKVFLRRTRREVGRELAPVSRIVEFVDYDEKVMHSVDDLAHHLAVRARTAEFAERGMALRELDMRVRQATGVAKAKQVAHFVRILVEGGNRVVVYGWHREVYRIWMEELRDLEPCMYTGTESAKQKAEAKESFITGDPKPIFISLRAGAGLDGLQHHCNIVVFGELDWSPGVHHQCIGRLDRDGQTEPVTAFFLVTDDGSDPPMMEVNGLKASEASQVIDPHLGAQTIKTDESALQRLVDRYLAKKPKVAS